MNKQDKERIEGIVHKWLDEAVETNSIQDGLITELITAGPGFSEEKDREIEKLRAYKEKIEHGFTYCAYCGKEFEIDGKYLTEEVAKHIHECEKHPIQNYKAETEKLRKENEELKAELASIRERVGKEYRKLATLRDKLSNLREGCFQYHEESDREFADNFSTDMGNKITEINSIIKAIHESIVKEER